MRDSHLRTIDYLRVSITDRCNLKCMYCVPSRGLPFLPRSEILTYEEILKIVRVSCRLGVKKVRVTGGEPLARKNIKVLLHRIAAIPELEDVSITTNGLLLLRYAKQLSEAGVKRINVSLDSLRADRFRNITRGGDLGVVMKGISEATRLGLSPIRINMVPMRGVNDDEIGDFAQLTLTTDYQVRFIELMPFGPSSCLEDLRMSSSEVMARVSERGVLSPIPYVETAGPARYFRFSGARGTIGFISPMSDHFCNSCNRLRVTADGKLRPCLFSETEIDLKAAMRRGGDDEEIERLILLAVQAKPRGHGCGDSVEVKRPMSRIGG